MNWLVIQWINQPNTDRRFQKAIKQLSFLAYKTPRGGKRREKKARTTSSETGKILCDNKTGKLLQVLKDASFQFVWISQWCPKANYHLFKTMTITYNNKEICVRASEYRNIHGNSSCVWFVEANTWQQKQSKVICSLLKTFRRNC